jgi:hypothetical protein
MTSNGITFYQFHENVGNQLLKHVSRKKTETRNVQYDNYRVPGKDGRGLKG